MTDDQRNAMRMLADNLLAREAGNASAWVDLDGVKDGSEEYRGMPLRVVK
jgi:hypothetical protein